MIVTPIQTHIFSEGDNLFSFITRYFRHIPETSIIVITSKIVALSEKRTISRERATKKELVTQESTFAIPTKYVDLTITQGVLIASAGIDESNAENDKFILLPKDSYRTARLLHTKLQKKYQVKNLGVIITDSVTLPLRAGVIGIAIGYAGFRGVRDYRGAKDIFGKSFVYSRTNIADSLATAATLVMGEGDERQPIAIIKRAPVTFCSAIKRAELTIAPEDDMYRPLLQPFLKK
jgi:coenzyme F420-0:L-glutamate ligase